MSVRDKVSAVLCGVSLCGIGTPSFADDEVPDIEFLEYLGMWEESDKDWQLHNDDAVAENETRSDPVPDGEESAEIKDES